MEMSMVDDGKQWVKEFARCPGCGSERRMFEEMGKELVERGLAKPDMHFYYEMKSGALANQAMMASVPIGGELPAFGVATDICLECGLLYAVRLERTSAKKGLSPVQMMPNRAQRRHGMQQGQGFNLPPFNPSLS